MKNKNPLHSLPKNLNPEEIEHLIHLSLQEDLSPEWQSNPQLIDFQLRDITSKATFLKGQHLKGKIFAKQAGIVAGLPIAQAVFFLVDPSIQFDPQVNDGDRVEIGQILAFVSGTSRSLFTAERTALNFLGRLSGIASLTQQFVQSVLGTQAHILDTRKTLPGFRHLDKYAVRMGGGNNHRMGLYDMVLIKDNHIDGAGGIQPAVERVREQYDNQFPIEVEVKNLEELQTALALNVDRIMLDNMNLETMRQAVEIANGRVKLEASGNVSLKRLRAIAETGVDFISVGALTHSVKVFDISMRVA